jgi:NAD-dependent SIR2 family protein deacetylase
LRNYTQNIDLLERIAGIQGECFTSLSINRFEENYLVESHGSFAQCKCIRCQEPHDIKHFWDSVADNTVPRCRKCDNIVRPNVVFFGEPLPDRFVDLRTQGRY